MHGHRATDAAVPSADKRHFALELASRLVRVLDEDGARVHLRLNAGLTVLMLRGESVGLCRIGHGCPLLFWVHGYLLYALFQAKQNTPDPVKSAGVLV